MKKRRSASARSLILTVAAIVAFSLLGSVYAGYQFTAVGREAAAVAANALPSTKWLTAARTELRQLNAALDVALRNKTRGQPFNGSLLEEHRLALQADLNRYQALPSFPGEPELFQTVVTDLRRFDDAKAQLIAMFETGTTAKIEDLENDTWRISGDRLDDSIHSLITFNIQQLGEQIRRIEEIRSWAFLVVTFAALLNILVGIFVAWRAATSIHRYEQLLEDRAAEWEIFSGRMAHDLLSPLQVVSFALSIAGGHSKDEQVVMVTERGLAALARARAITDALLEFARAGGQPTPGERVSVPGVVLALLDELHASAEENHIELSSEPIPPIEVACSAGVLNVLLANLLRNAIKYMGDRSVRRVVLKMAVGTKKARFEVHDTGPGVASEDGRNVFDPFVRGDVPGVSGIGLGLATVKRIAEAYGGTIGVHSAKSGGSVFWFEIPNAPALTSTAPLPLAKKPLPTPPEP